MWQAQVVINVVLVHQLTTSVFAEKAAFERKDEIDVPFHRGESISSGDKRGVRIISKGNFHFLKSIYYISEMLFTFFGIYDCFEFEHNIHVLNFSLQERRVCML